MLKDALRKFSISFKVSALLREFSATMKEAAARMDQQSYDSIRMGRLVRRKLANAKR